MITEELLKKAEDLYDKDNYKEIITLLSQEELEKHNNARLYFIAAFSNSQRGNYEHALALYTKSIEIDSSNGKAYNNRGALLGILGKYREAVPDCLKAVELDPQNSMYHRNLGDVYSKMGNYAEAEKVYAKAVSLAPANIAYKAILYETRAKQGVLLKYGNIDSLPKYAQTELSTLKLDDTQKKDMIIACSKAYEPIETLRRLLVYKGSNPVVHYTSRKTANLLVKSDAKMRFNNGVFMNDPEEGKVFMQYLNNEPLRQAAMRGGMAGDNNVYIGSFMPANKDDYLVMWRTYGKESTGEEATGCSITIDSAFFDSGDGGMYEESSMRLTNDATKVDKGEKHDGKSASESASPQVLYHVLYYDKSLPGLVEDELLKGNMQAIKEALVELSNVLSNLLKLKDKADKRDESDLNKAINKIIYRFVSELSYLFKSADYQTEQEVRVVKYHSPEKEIVKVNEEIDGKPLSPPFRVYIESNKPVSGYIRKIVMGPKVPHPEQWLYLEVKLRKQGNNIQFQSSQCKFQ